MAKDLNGNALSVGTRVRLFSGRDSGTIETLGPNLALVRWDARPPSGSDLPPSGQSAVWATNCLVALAPDA